MLYNGEEIGDGSGPAVDVAVDPLEGTRLTALGQPNAIAVIAVAERGTMFIPAPRSTWTRSPSARGGGRDRHQRDPDRERPCGREGEGPRRHRGDGRRARARPPQGVDRRAAPVRRAREPDPRRRRRSLDRRRAGVRRRRHADGHRRHAGGRHLRRGDQVPARRDPGQALAAKRRGAAEALDSGYDLDRVLTTDDLVSGEDVFVAATGVTSGVFLRGVRVSGAGVETESIVMRSRSGTVRTHRCLPPFRESQTIDERRPRWPRMSCTKPPRPSSQTTGGSSPPTRARGRSRSASTRSRSSRRRRAGAPTATCSSRRPGWRSTSAASSSTTRRSASPRPTGRRSRSCSPTGASSPGSRSTRARKSSRSRPARRSPRASTASASVSRSTAGSAPASPSGAP